MKLRPTLRLLTLIALLPISVHADGSAPIAFRSAVGRLAVRVGSPESSIKIEYTAISEKVSVDPGIGAFPIEKFSSVSILLDANEERDRIIAMWRGLERANWTATDETIEFSKLRIRALGPWNEVIGELMINEVQSSIRIGGIWYLVTPESLNQFLNELRQCICDRVDVAPHGSLQGRSTTTEREGERPKDVTP